ncbi:DMT family transporter [Burkholderia ubonensis]|uniref:DMT family transporter n=1 Tax=Burkholderia ubonensis TaxID=101571 RepID=UPI00075EAF2E|nr:DMT family transporter [Burkholderia ubonensis]KVS41039.1 hypothetical protein WK37_21060 [Burkholderia ubonensis]KVS53199.1 hypothetical protein WK38_09980 [Burkholderia ubonensis]KVS71394.1 hypothetical protein WK42_25435 [Burkholderia ubonensis]KVS83467.1 hypothetical protein WK43_25425 [Burkholderia ubonensis]KVS88600.1 hypothetical protein WK45_27995 [Burkholderia ubonensis]
MKHEAKLAIVVFIWGINYLVIPYGVGAMGSGPFTLMRFAITLPILFMLMGLRRDFRVERADWGRIALIGIAGTTGYQAAFAAAVDQTTTTNAAILFSLSPIFSVILNCVSGREKPIIVNWIGLAIAFAGGAVMVMSDGQVVSLESKHLTGDVLMLLAAILWAVTAFLSEGCLKKYGGLKTTAWSLPSGIAGLILFSGTATARLDLTSVPASAWWSLAFAIMGATVIGVVMFYDALPHLGTRQVMSSMYLIPAIAIVSSCVLTQTWLTKAEIVGIALALFGVTLAKRKVARIRVTSEPVEMLGSASRGQRNV